VDLVPIEHVTKPLTDCETELVGFAAEGGSVGTRKASLRAMAWSAGACCQQAMRTRAMAAMLMEFRRECSRQRRLARLFESIVDRSRSKGRKS